MSLIRKQIKTSGLTIGVDGVAYEMPSSDGTVNQILKTDGSGNVDWIAPSAVIVASQKYDLVVAASDETTALTAGPTTVLTTFRAPRAFTLTNIRATLTTAQPSGTQLLTIDVRNTQVDESIMSTKITFDNGEKTSSTASTQPVLSTTDILVDDEFTVYSDLVGDSGASGLKIILIGTVP